MAFAMFCECLGSIVFLNKLFLAHLPVLLVHLGAGVVAGVAQQELLGALSGFAWHLRGRGRARGAWRLRQHFRRNEFQGWGNLGGRESKP